MAHSDAGDVTIRSSLPPNSRPAISHSASRFGVNFHRAVLDGFHAFAAFVGTPSAESLLCNR